MKVNVSSVRHLAGLDVPSPLYEDIQSTFRALKKRIPQFEKFLSRACGKKVKLVHPVRRTGAHTLAYRFACGRKGKAAVNVSRNRPPGALRKAWRSFSPEDGAVFLAAGADGRRLVGCVISL